jgi:hypothetical protein
MIYRFAKKKNIALIIICICQIFCNPVKLQRVQSNTQNRKIIFLGLFENDTIIISQKNKTLIDTVLTSEPLRSIIFVYNLSNQPGRIKINNDTIFDIGPGLKEYNYFIVKKEYSEYLFYKAKDTIIGTL